MNDDMKALEVASRLIEVDQTQRRLIETYIELNEDGKVSDEIKAQVSEYIENATSTLEAARQLANDRPEIAAALSVAIGKIETNLERLRSLAETPSGETPDPLEQTRQVCRAYRQGRCDAASTGETVCWAGV